MAASSGQQWSGLPYLNTTATMAFKIVLLACVVALVRGGVVAPAAPVLAAYSAPVVAAPAVAARLEEFDARPQYSFGYDVADALTGDYKSQQEVRDGDVVQGSYSLIEADGTKRTVDYAADPINGFNAVVRNDPIVAAAPAVVAEPAVVPARIAAAPAVVEPAVVAARYAAAPVVAARAPVYAGYNSAPFARLTSSPVAYTAPLAYSPVARYSVSAPLQYTSAYTAPVARVGAYTAAYGPAAVAV